MCIVQIFFFSIMLLILITLFILIKKLIRIWSKKITKHPLGQLLEIYNSNGNLCKSKLLWGSLIIALGSAIIFYCSKSDSYALIVNFTDLYKSILPNLLGFSLGAYALLIALASPEVLGKMREPYRDTKYSLYQYACAVYGFYTLIMTLALIVTVIFHLGLEIGKGKFFQVGSSSTADIFNLVFLAILNFFGLYSIFLLTSAIGSIFSTSQAANAPSQAANGTVAPKRIRKKKVPAS